MVCIQKLINLPCLSICWKKIVFLDTRVVGPLLTSPPKPVSAELETFMQSSEDSGVILVSFGSMLSSVSSVDNTILSVMVNAFAKLPQKIIWKLSEGN